MKRRLDEKKTPISFKKWGHSPIPNQTSQFLPWMQEKSQRIRNSTWGDIGDEYTKKGKGIQMDFSPGSSFHPLRKQGAGYFVQGFIAHEWNSSGMNNDDAG